MEHLFYITGRFTWSDFYPSNSGKRGKALITNTLTQLSLFDGEKSLISNICLSILNRSPQSGNRIGCFSWKELRNQKAIWGSRGNKGEPCPDIGTKLNFGC